MVFFFGRKSRFQTAGNFSPWQQDISSTPQTLQTYVGAQASYYPIGASTGVWFTQP
jgi:hypothetical protein